MIIDTIEMRIESELEIQSFVYGQAKRSYGWEYMVLSEDEEDTGYPIEPLVYGVKKLTYETDLAFLIDNAGIIWTRRDGVFERCCKGASLAYVITYFGSFEAVSVDKLSLKQHNKWCLAAGEE